MINLLIMFSKTKKHHQTPGNSKCLVSNRSKVVSLHIYRHTNHMTMTISRQIKRIGKLKVVRFVWDFDCLHFVHMVLTVKIPDVKRLIARIHLADLEAWYSDDINAQINILIYTKMIDHIVLIYSLSYMNIVLLIYKYVIILDNL